MASTSPIATAEKGVVPRAVNQQICNDLGIGLDVIQAVTHPIRPSS